MNELNNEITKLEKSILDKKEDLNKGKKTRDIAINARMKSLEEKYYADNKRDKELSTIDKRKVIALENNAISELVHNLKDLDHTIQILEIERDYSLRELDIKKLEFGEAHSLKSIAKSLKMMSMASNQKEEE